MPDDEDHIRQFMPVLRRIIILVAVLTAIPVVMWTITAFVRTYVGPPKTPTFQRTADAMPASSTADAAAPGDNGTTGSTPTAPSPILEAKEGATDADANALPSDANAATPPAMGAMSAVPANAAPPNNNPASADSASPATAAPIPAPPPAAMVQTDGAAKVAAPTNTAAPPTSPATADAAELPASNPPAYASPSQSPDDGVQVAAQPPAPTDWPTASAPAVASLPEGVPILGPVPLPHKRPKTSVLAQGPIPLPMPRPEVAGPGAPQAAPTPFDWLQHIFHPASGASAAPPPAEDNDGYVDTPH